MDMSGAMPRKAWVEIRSTDGELLESVSAEISGGGISAKLPTFPPGTMGTIQLCTDDGTSVSREQAGVEKLPTTPVLFHAQIG